MVGEVTGKWVLFMLLQGIVVGAISLLYGDWSGATTY